MVPPCLYDEYRLSKLEDRKRILSNPGEKPEENLQRIGDWGL